MTPKEIQDLADSVKVFSALMAGIGALLGAMIGGPLLEWFKDQIGARRSWQSRRAEIIAALRLVFARCDAFLELYDAGTHVANRDPEAATAYRASLAHFDFLKLIEKVDTLAPLDPSTSVRSAAGQYLVQQLSLLLSLLTQLKALTADTPAPPATEREARLLNEVRERLSDIKLFAGTLYSDALRVKLTLYDPELARHNFLVNKMKFETAYAARQRHARELLDLIDTQEKRKADPVGK